MIRLAQTERNSFMDITRNWRLKTNRSYLLATRCPTTGEVRLPQQTASLAEEVEIYTFETEGRQVAVAEGLMSYAKAAR
jgi:uncharacterized OB-fold protein